MNKTVLRHAWENLHEAKAAYERMRSVRSLADMEQCWAQFLAATGTVFNKLESGTKGHPKSGPWFGEIRHQRKTDELLVYIHHARNTREHGITEVTERNLGRFTVFAGDVHIHEVRVTGDGEVQASFSGLNPDRPPVVGITPSRLALVPVLDRGQVYDPPKTHMGAPVNGTDPVAVAGLGLAYVERIVREAVAHVT